MTAPATTKFAGRAGNQRWFPASGASTLASLLASVAAIGAVLSIRDTAVWGTTYGGASIEAAIADLAAGLGLVGAGWYVAADPQRRGLGTLLLLAGAAWLSADIVGWQEAPASVRIAALAGAILFVPFLLHVVAVAPGGSFGLSATRPLVILFYATGLVLGLATMLGRDPLWEASCWDLCTANPLALVHEAPLTGSLVRATEVLGVIGGCAVAVLAAVRLAGSTRANRRDAATMMVPSLLAGATVAARWLLLAWTDSAGPFDPVAMAFFQASAWAVAGMALGVTLVVRAKRHTRAAIAALVGVDEATGRPRAAARVLADATGDTSLRLAYPLSGTPDCVDADGKYVKPIANDERSLITVSRRGETVALIDHDAQAVESADLAEHLGPAVRLALENERLNAELLARLHELRESRARIVSAADTERRRRERSLHDGAQQRLLALMYDLRSAREACAAGSDETAARRLDAAIEAVHAAHDELREVAHGIYPAVLAEAGLGPALEGLVDRAPIALHTRVDDSRYEPGTEMTTYVVAEELVRDAARRGAGQVWLELTNADGQLRLEELDDGLAPDGPIVHAVDRAGASGGDLVVVGAVDGAVHLRLEVPCVSS